MSLPEGFILSQDHIYCSRLVDVPTQMIPGVM